MGFTAWGGLFATLFNLYLLRLNYGPEVIGQINAIGSLAFGVLCLPAGWIGARWGSRRAMIAGLTLVGSSQFLVPQAVNVPETYRLTWLMATNLLGSLGAALYAVNTAPYLMGITAPTSRSYVFSAQSSVWPLSAFAGSLLGGFLPGIFARFFGLAPAGPQPYRLALMVSAACFIPAVLVMLAAKDGSSTPARVASTEAVPAPWGFIIVMALVVALQVSGEGAIRTFFNVYMDQGLGIPTAQIGMMASLGNLVAGTAALFTPFLVMRMGISRTFVATSLGMSALMLPIALIPWAPAAGLSFAGVIGAASMSRPVINLYQMDNVPARWRSAIAAGSTLAVGASWAIVASAGGVIIVQSGYTAMFLGAATLTAAGAVLFAVYRRFRREAPDPVPQSL
jgi:MFS family permease